MSAEVAVRRAGPEDAPEAARLLHDFNTEFEDPSPGVSFMTERTRELMAAEEATILLAGAGPDGIAVVRLRPALWASGLDAYLEELYVVPDRRSQGIGRALIDLGTSVADTAAIGLYESEGFTNKEGEPDGPMMLVYERDL
jgi:GNAT superfamily N-acetyltransferase